MFLLICCLLDDISSVERIMTMRPKDAILIAREAASRYPGNDEALRRIFKHAAQVQNTIVLQLSAEQVSELSSLYRTFLVDVNAAARIESEWLTHRRRSMSTPDAKARSELARLYWEWRRDRDTAITLCHEALQHSPDFVLAKQLLQAIEAVTPPIAWRDRVEQLKIGMTMKEVEKLLGSPSQKSQQILFRRCREQWRYNKPSLLQLDWDCALGRDPSLISIVTSP